jgi:hypothetical protein
MRATAQFWRMTRVGHMLSVSTESVKDTAMRLLIAALAAAGLAAAAAPALADTLQEITTHGMVVTLGDMDIDLSFTPDGKFSGLDGQITGTWKIDGDKLCTNSNFDPNETCLAYPKDKKSGDTFDLVAPTGTVRVKIK